MKNKKIISLVLVGIFLVISGIFFLAGSIAEGTSVVDQECNSEDISVTYYYKEMPLGLGGTAYVASLNAGDCTKTFRGEIEETSNVESLIEEDIQAKIDGGQITLSLTGSPVFESNSGEFVTSG